MSSKDFSVIEGLRCSSSTFQTASAVVLCFVGVQLCRLGIALLIPSVAKFSDPPSEAKSLRAALVLLLWSLSGLLEVL